MSSRSTELVSKPETGYNSSIKNINQPSGDLQNLYQDEMEDQKIEMLQNDIQRKISRIENME
jgi:hypothetical protein